ncbi:hypothetical protein PG996_011140 [Apiospora saccharicola]|uniref:Uncharacterized protein n=1 Tax=Apiospora saccharicola TaxID=335842 RepID=A0ABR1UE78_9PEZI
MSNTVPQPGPAPDDVEEPWDPENPPTHRFSELLRDLSIRLEYSPTRQPADENTSADDETPEESGPSAGNTSTAPDQGDEFVIPMDKPVSSVKGLTAEVERLKGMATIPEDWGLFKDMPIKLLVDSIQSLSRVERSVKINLDQVQVKAPSHAPENYKQYLEHLQGTMRDKAQRSLRDMIENMVKEHDKLAKNEEGRPKDMVAYNSTMRAAMDTAVDELDKETKGFVEAHQKSYNIHNKNGPKFWRSMSYGILGSVILLFFTSSFQHLLQKVGLGPAAPDVSVNLNLTLNLEGPAFTATNQATEANFYIPPVDLNLILDAASLGQNNDLIVIPIIIEFKQSIPSEGSRASPPTRTKRRLEMLTNYEWLNNL